MQNFTFFLIIIAIWIGLSSFSSAIHCSQTGKALNYKTEWHYWAGCVVEKPDGNRVLLQQMRDMEK